MAFWPATETELTAAGYVLDPLESLCRSCPARVRWCTTPNKKKMPLSIVRPSMIENLEGERPTLLYQSHFADCPQGQAWSKKGRSKGSASTVAACLVLAVVFCLGLASDLSSQVKGTLPVTSGGRGKQKRFLLNVNGVILETGNIQIESGCLHFWTVAGSETIVCGNVSAVEKPQH